MSLNTLRLVLLGAVSGTGLVAQAQVLAPDLRCASVNAVGDVTLNWLVPADPGGDFLAYEIWHANSSAGPFSLIATVPLYGQVSHFHVGAGANAGPQFYYMTTVSNGAPPTTSSPSDTIATLFLQVFQSTPLGSANLSWNAPATAASAALAFTIWLEYPVGAWTQIGTVASTVFAYQHVIDICEDSLTFRIGLADASGCLSFSNRDGEIFRDASPPSVPVIQSVSVDTASCRSVVTWSPSPQPDTDGYIIVFNGAGGAVIVDTVFGQFNTSYEWGDSWPFGGSESFTVAAFDTCFTGNPPSPNTSATGTAHTTMYARTEYNRCDARVRIRWTPYAGWTPQSIQLYYRALPGASSNFDCCPADPAASAWTLLANVDGSATFHDHDVQPGYTYYYVVKAIQGTGPASSLSNITCRFTQYPAIPSGNYIRTVTVTGPGSIQVVDSVDVNAQVNGYRLERSKNGGPYAQVAAFPGSAGPVIVYNDIAVDPAANGYRYRMQVLDSCGRGTVVSNIGANMVLVAEPGLDGVNRLRWNGYVQWAGAVAGYIVHRSVAGAAFEPIAVLPSDPWEYADDVNAFVAETGDFCYYVEAFEAGNPAGIDATSSSNIACAYQQELVFIPNAFIIGSTIAENRQIRPVIGFTDVAEYRFLIINRWNQVIWETQKPEEGWSGVVGSQVMPQGIYAYYCSVRNGAGRLVVKRGTVLLMRDE